MVGNRQHRENNNIALAKQYQKKLLKIDLLNKIDFIEFPEHIKKNVNIYFLVKHEL